MKILGAIIIPPHLSVSGGVNAGLALCEEVSRYCDVDVALMALEAGEERLGNARLLRQRSTNPLGFTRAFLPNRFRTMFYRSRIADLVARGDYDLVHIFNPIPAGEMKRIARACLRDSIPYVVSTHGFVEVSSQGRAYGLRLHERLVWRHLIQRPLRFVVENTSMVFATSPHDIELASEMGTPAHRISLVTNGVDRFFHADPTPDEVASTCATFNLPHPAASGVPVCFFLGNHTKNKGVHVLLDAFTRTRRPYLLIVGGERRDYVPYQDFTARLRPGQRMCFTGSLTNTQIRALYHCANLFVFPSLSDTLPLVVLEAMASGLPVLSTRVGGIPYQVDEACGRLVEANDPEALKDAFEELSVSLEALRTMGAAARRTVRARFDWERSGREAFALYQSILGYDTGTAAVSTSGAVTLDASRSPS